MAIHLESAYDILLAERGLRADRYESVKKTVEFVKEFLEDFLHTGEVDVDIRIEVENTCDSLEILCEELFAGLAHLKEPISVREIDEFLDSEAANAADAAIKNRE